MKWKTLWISVRVRHLLVEIRSQRVYQIMMKAVSNSRSWGKNLAVRRPLDNRVRILWVMGRYRSSLEDLSTNILSMICKRKSSSIWCSLRVALLIPLSRMWNVKSKFIRLRPIKILKHSVTHRELITERERRLRDGLTLRESNFTNRSSQFTISIRAW